MEDILPFFISDVKENHLVGLELLKGQGLTIFDLLEQYPVLKASEDCPLGIDASIEIANIWQKELNGVVNFYFKKFYFDYHVLNIDVSWGISVSDIRKGIINPTFALTNYRGLTLTEANKTVQYYLKRIITEY